MSSSSPLVSVIMNCYNGEKYLRKAIDSVITQTYTNWEIIFWDNQSTDGSANIFNKIDNNRLKYFYAPFHSTLYSARNHAIKKSKGDFIAFLDVDDYWISTKLELQVSLFTDKKIGLVYSNFFWKNEIKGLNYIAHKKKLPSGFVLDDILKGYNVGLLTIIVRRSALLRVQPPFNSKYNIIGDYDMTTRLAVDWKFGVIQTPTAYCRWHGGNLQIIEQGRQIHELCEWIALSSKNYKISQNKEFVKLGSNIKRMKSVYEAQNGNYLYSIKSFFKIPGLKNKLKIITAIILPKAIFNKITGR
jgi:glycosyltransferase involved in cell wall biosynthesis